MIVTCGSSMVQPNREMTRRQLAATLLERDEHRVLVAGSTGVHEMQAHQRLAGPGWSGDQRGGTGPIAILEGVVEGSDAGRQALADRHGQLGVAWVGKTREQDEAVGSDAVDVIPRQEVAPAQLADAEIADRSVPTFVWSRPR